MTNVDLLLTPALTLVAVAVCHEAADAIAGARTSKAIAADAIVVDGRRRCISQNLLNERGCKGYASEYFFASSVGPAPADVEAPKI